MVSIDTAFIILLVCFARLAKKAGKRKRAPLAGSCTLLPPEVVAECYM